VENLQIGTYGWQYEAWRDAFYPEDLPEDWMLDYYGNAYRVVMVPEQSWLAWSEEDIEDVIEAVEDEFGFYLEVVDTLGSAKLEQLKKIKKSFAEGLEAGESQAYIALVIFSESKGAVEAKIDLPTTLVSKSQALGGWQWKNQDRICSGSPCAVVYDLTTDAKQQTALLQDFMKSLPTGQVGAPLFLHDRNLDIKKVYTLKTIGEFLGY